MLNNLLQYSGIITKSKALERDLMTIEDYGKIASLDNVADFINYLKGKQSYEQIFHDYDEQALHRSKIEQLIKNSLFLSFAKLYRFANNEQRTLLNLVFLRMETDVLKSCLQNVFNEEESYDLSLFEPFFLQHSNLKVTALAASKNMDELIHNLIGTDYYTKFIKWHNSSHTTLHDYEVQLDILYFTKVWRLMDRLLKGSDKKAFSTIIGHKIDLLNIECIYRSRLIYDFDPSTILTSLIPVTYKLNTAQYKQLVEAISKEDFLRILHNTFYGKTLDQIDDSTLESQCNRLTLKAYKITASKYPASMAPILYYLYRKELELDRLTTSLECIRYQLDPNEAIKLILN